MKRWETFCKRVSTKENGANRSQSSHKHSESKGCALGSDNFQMDNMVALTNLVKIGGATNQEITNLSKEIWRFRLSKAIAVTAEYLPKSLNIKADDTPRHF